MTRQVVKNITDTVRNYELKQLIKAGTVKTVYTLSNDSIYEAGKYYYCSYWAKYYKVLEVQYDNQYGYPILKDVMIRWQDGKVATHKTDLDRKRDYQIELA